MNTICPKTTKIYIDRDLGENELHGEDFAFALHKKGFKRLFLATGYEPDQFVDKPWLQVIGKDCPFL